MFASCDNLLFRTHHAASPNRGPTSVPDTLPEAGAGDLKVSLVALNADERAARAKRGHACCAAAHEGVEDHMFGLREKLDQLVHERDRLLGRVLLLPTLD
jgi:hypothetical protein